MRHIRFETINEEGPASKTCARQNASATVAASDVRAIIEDSEAQGERRRGEGNVWGVGHILVVIFIALVFHHFVVTSATLHRVLSATAPPRRRYRTPKYLRVFLNKTSMASRRTFDRSDRFRDDSHDSSVFAHSSSWWWWLLLCDLASVFGIVTIISDENEKNDFALRLQMAEEDGHLRRRAVHALSFFSSSHKLRKATLN